MSSISHSHSTRLTVDPYRAPDYSFLAPSEPGRQNSFRTAPPAPRTEIKPGSFGNNLAPIALMGMLTELFKQFFSQLQSLLQGDVRPPEPKSNDLPVPQPRVQPAPDTPPVDKPKEPIPELSTKRNGAKPNNIWNGFRQGNKGNCVTVSAIKAAMAKFGQSPTDIYKSVEKVAEGCKVVMRDGFALTLKKSELDSAIRGADFVPMNDWEMLKDAHFLFACSAKRAQMENNDGVANRSFDAAITSLNDKEDESGPGEGLKRLGLKDHMKHVSTRDFADKSLIGMVNRRGHSVAVVDGSEEYYGNKGERPIGGQAIALV